MEIITLLNALLGIYIATSYIWLMLIIADKEKISDVAYTIVLIPVYNTMLLIAQSRLLIKWLRGTAL